MIRKIWLVGAVFVLLVGAATPALGGENLLKNPGFEEVVDNQISSWTPKGNPSDKGVNFSPVTGEAHSGAKSFSIANLDDNDAWLIQEVKVEKNKVYRLGYWLRIDRPLEKKTGGANISVINGIYSSPEFFDTRGQWEYHEAYVRTREISPEVLQVALRLGGYANPNKGQAYFDDVIMEAVDNPPPGVTISDLGNTDAPANAGEVASNNEGHRDGTGVLAPNKTFLYVLIGLIVLGLLIFVEIKFAKKNGGVEMEEAAGKEDN
jgi:hypothetical protein